MFETISSSWREDADLLALNAARYEACRSVLDAGSGSGYLVSRLLHLRTDLHVSGIEIDSQLLKESQIQIGKLGSSSLRSTLIQADIFLADLPKVDLVITNPPWIPGESGFLVEHRGCQEVFFDSLLRVCAASDVPLLANWYGYRNISGASDPHDRPQLERLARDLGFNLKVLEIGWRVVAPLSRIWAGISQMKGMFPCGLVESNGRISELKSLNVEDTNHLRIGQMIVLLIPDVDQVR